MNWKYINSDRKKSFLILKNKYYGIGSNISCLILVIKLRYPIYDKIYAFFINEHYIWEKYTHSQNFSSFLLTIVL